MISTQPRAVKSYNTKPDTRRSQGSRNKRLLESDSGNSWRFPRRGRERKFHRIKKIRFSLFTARIVSRAPCRWRFLPLAETRRFEASSLSGNSDTVICPASSDESGSVSLILFTWDSLSPAHSSSASCQAAAGSIRVSCQSNGHRAGVSNRVDIR